MQSRIDLEALLDPIAATDVGSVTLGRSFCIGADGTVFLSSQLGLVSFTIDSNGTPGSARLLLVAGGSRFGPMDLSPDGRRLAIGLSDKPGWKVLDVAVLRDAGSATAVSEIEESGQVDSATWFLGWRTNDELVVWTSGAITCIDTRGKRVLWSSPAGSGYAVRSLNRRFLLIPSLTARESAVLRAEDGHLHARFGLPSDDLETNLFGAVSDDGNRAVVGRYNHNQIYRWRRGQEDVLKFAVPGSRGDSGAGFAFLPRSQRAVIYWPESVFLVNSDDGTILSWCDVSPSVGLDFGPAWGLRVSPDGHRCLLLTDRELVVLGIQ